MSENGLKLIELSSAHQMVLLHCCCAPCSGGIIERLLASGIKMKLYFYNPNIHPRGEYELRKQQVLTFAQQKGLDFIDEDYDSHTWFEKIKGMEDLGERSERCSICFDMRMMKAAAYAKSQGISMFATTLSISRWKDMAMVQLSANKAAQNQGVIFWDYNWRNDNGGQYSSRVAKRENFYRQEYCGCLYSLRDANAVRISKGKEIINRDIG